MKKILTEGKVMHSNKEQLSDKKPINSPPPVNKTYDGIVYKKKVGDKEKVSHVEIINHNSNNNERKGIMKFKKEFLQNIVYEEWDQDEYNIEVIKKEIYETSRWLNYYELIFKFNDKYYMSHYSVGATEIQDERPYECDGDEIECKEVVPVEEKIIVYKPIPVELKPVFSKKGK